MFLGLTYRFDEGVGQRVVVAGVLVARLVASLQVRVSRVHQLLGLQHVFVLALWRTVHVRIPGVSRELLGVVICQWQVDISILSVVLGALFHLLLDHVALHPLDINVDGLCGLLTPGHVRFLQL